MTELTPSIRLLVVAENPLARAGLAALLRDQAGLDVVGQAGLDELEAALDLHQPDGVVCDLGYDPLRGVDTLGDAIHEGPWALVLVAGGQNTISEALPALLGAQVRAMLPENSPPDQLIAALHATAAGLTVFGPGILPPFQVVPEPPAALQTSETFTPREREVLALLAEGLPNKLIARRLQITEHTVKFHVNALLAKLGAASRTEAVVRATRLGLIAL